MADFIFYPFLFLIGLVWGSFLNSVIFRLKTGESLLFSRSHCPHCKHLLGWQDLIPVFSFLVLKGRCRYCKKPISWQYPLVELATSTFFVLIPFYLNCRLPVTIYYLIITSLLLVIFVFDLKYLLIPDRIIYPAIGLTVLFLVYEFWSISGRQRVGFVSGVVGSAVGATVFLGLLYSLSQGRWMGLGDVKLAFLLGLFLGFPKILICLFLAFFIGALFGIGLIILGKKTLKSKIPFAPFLITSAFIALFFGDTITSRFCLLSNLLWKMNLGLP